jgi:hypothetical protein
MAYFRTLLHQIVPIVLLCVALIGCDAPGEPELTVEVTAEPTTDATIEVPPSTGEISPTSTESPTVVPQPSHTPTHTGAPTATVDPQSLYVDSWPDLLSPDGQWIAKAFSSFPMNNETGDYYMFLSVERTDGSQKWVIVDEWSNLRLGYPMPRPLDWSQDGRYFYYTDYIVGDGCGSYLWNASNIMRVDLTDGSTGEWVPSISESLAISPDDQFIAYLDNGNIVFREIATGEERTALIFDAWRDADIGAIVWSPDQSSVMITVSFSFCTRERIHSIIRIDVASLTHTVLIDHDAQGYETVDWPEQDRVLVKDKDDVECWLDPITGELTPRE